MIKDTWLSAGRVDVMHADDEYLVRDRDKPNVVLTFTRDEWTAFIGGVKDGEFDGDVAEE